MCSFPATTARSPSGAASRAGVAFARIRRHASFATAPLRPFLPLAGSTNTIERSQLRRVPRFQAGDRLRVHFQVVEGTRKRTQVFEGVVIKRQGNGARETFT